MSGLAATLKLDVVRQARSRLYGVGVFIAIVSGLLGRAFFGPEDAGPFLATLSLLSLGGTTYIFGASLVLMDKTEGTLSALRASPLTANAYIASKVVTLTAFSMIECAIIYAVGFFGTPLDFVSLFGGVALLGVFYSLLSMGQVAAYDSVFSFLIPGAMIVGSVTQWPALFVLSIGPPELWYFIPTQGPLLVMLGSSEHLATWQWIYALAMSGASITLAALWAKRRFAHFIGMVER